MLAVVVFHLNPAWLPGGFAGVDVFFVLSGFLITGILLREHAAGTFQFRRFYQRRIARILPAFLAAALATLLAARWLCTTQDFASAGAGFSAALLSVSNFHLLQQGRYFDLSPDAQPFLHYWSLAVEEQFYLIFPPALHLLLKQSPATRWRWLGAATLASLACGIALSSARPQWAFYLLPARAWELLAGVLLAVWQADRPRAVVAPGFPVPRFLPQAALISLGASFCFLQSTWPFPGWIALWPVLSTVILLGSLPASPIRWLSARPVVAIGKISYSLYLWHWPIFSFVDYALPLASPATRLALKISITLAATLASWFWIEQPWRKFLNRPVPDQPIFTKALPRPAFCFALLFLLSLSPLGFAIRRDGYLDASSAAGGPLEFPATGSRPTVVLMGDSQASMYGVALRELTRQRNLRFLLLSVAGGDPLAPSPGTENPLWQKNLATIQREKPALVILTCHWIYKLSADPARLAATVAALTPHTRRLLLLTQPPLLPPSATRAGMRQGGRPPWRESPADHAARTRFRNLLLQSSGPATHVLGLEPLLGETGSGLPVFDDGGRPLYQDPLHLSNFGTARVLPLLEAQLAILSPATPLPLP